MFMLSELQLISLTILIIYTIGYFYRKKRSKHIPMMLFAYCSDLALILYIELNRGAIEQTIGFPDGILGFHIIISIGAFLSSTILVILGILLYKGKEKLRPIHKYLAYLFFILRYLNFITSLMI